jgi:hypothetical protein
MSIDWNIGNLLIGNNGQVKGLVVMSFLNYQKVFPDKEIRQNQFAAYLFGKTFINGQTLQYAGIFNKKDFEIYSNKSFEAYKKS